ncbi:helix-turn-helix domain-containing protein [Anaeroselena agilis]|uniref:Helix-turn-helix transcriptional regulator n=1 Tax=Anaeroselena agilis TaxID=3063788 RepID=A0ABU3NWC6_9FIRM|nr:helix-turn-helix transcriptional regulator [Selenomonadales bacterium 4137-cl]
MKNIGRRIKFIRRNKKITQENLAIASGVKRAMIAKIETGVSIGSVETLNKIATALGVTVAELIDEQAATSEPPTPAA